jgi:hypothetical protein
MLGRGTHRSGLIAIILLALVAYGAAAAGQAKQGRIEPKADEILRRMSHSLASAKALRFRAHDMVDQVMETGQKLQFSRTLDVAARRPGAFRASVRGDAEDVEYAYTGGKLTIVNNRERCYALQDVPQTIDEMFDFLAERYGITAPLADLLFSDPYEAMTGRVRVGQYLGLHLVGQTQCHHLAFRQEGIDWQIWIEDSERAVPCKVVITYKEMPGQPQFTALLDKWDLSADVPDTTLALPVPAGYKRVDLEPAASPATEPVRP